MENQCLSNGIINKDDDEEVKQQKQFNIKILADKKPYFMCYIYPHEMRKYKTYVKKVNKNCIIRFGATLDQMTSKADKSEEEQQFIDSYHYKMPVNIYPSLMNKICYRIEEEMDGVLKRYKGEFDYSMLKNNDVEYSKSNYDKIRTLHKKYKRETKKYFTESSNEEREDGFTKSDLRKIFVQRFKQQAEVLCSNKDELCNIVLDLCYINNESKQFAWDVCGETIINNLLIKQNYKIQYPELNINGDIEYGGMKFSMKEIHINGEELYEDNLR